MSYCRWSSDDFQSDLYVYESVDGGFTIHVAGRRHDIDRSALPAPVDYFADTDAWFARHREVDAAIRSAALVDIGLPHDGESFYGLDAEECAAKVEELEALGYYVPAGVADAIRSDEVM